MVLRPYLRVQSWIPFAGNFEYRCYTTYILYLLAVCARGNGILFHLDADERAVEPLPASLEARELGMETTVSLCSAISLSFLSRSSARSSSIILLIAFSVKLLA